MYKMNTKDENNPIILMIAVFATIFVVPFSVASLYYYILLKKKYLAGGYEMRIIDIRRAFQRSRYGFMLAISLMVGAGYVLALASGKIVELFFYSVLLLVSSAVLAIMILTAKAFAVGLIGVVIDKRGGVIHFPTDGVLRSFSSVSVILNSIIPCSMETIRISDILSINRQAGRTLLIHGQFGSRAITFSDKLRRDQLLSCLSGYKRFNDLEGASSGDYA